MWKRAHPEKVSNTEEYIDRREWKIKTLVEELAEGTKELKSLLQGEKVDPKRTN